MKYPLKKPLVGDGPSCRICGCTHHTPCVDEETGPCGWLKEPAYTFEFMPPICTACAGTALDLAYVNRRFAKLLKFGPAKETRKRMSSMLEAAARRAEKRHQEENQQ